jgi:hypothetical protein
MTVLSDAKKIKEWSDMANIDKRADFEKKHEEFFFSLYSLIVEEAKKGETAIIIAVNEDVKQVGLTNLTSHLLTKGYESNVIKLSDLIIVENNPDKEAQDEFLMISWGD